MELNLIICVYCFKQILEGLILLNIKRIITIIIAVVFISCPAAANAETNYKNDNIITNTVMENSEKLEINAEIPEITGLDNQGIQKEINSLINNTFEKDKAAIQKAAEQLMIPGNKSVLFVTNEVKTDNENLLSFVVTNYLYSGGANGITRVDYYNIDKEKNCLLALSDLFSDDSDYKKIINLEIQKQIDEALKTDFGMYFTDNDYAFKEIRTDQGFYIKDNNLVIGFNKYEIAPGATGTPEFEIPIDKLGDIFIFNNADNVLMDSQAAVKVNGYNVQFYINNPKDKVVMVKLRDLAKHLLYNLNWDSSDNSIELMKGNNSYSIKIGENKYQQNQMIPIALESAPVIKDGLTYVPISFAEKLLKAEIEITNLNTR